MEAARALVVGGASGLGAALAVKLAVRGARVAVADRNAAGAESVVAACQTAGASAHAVIVDLASADGPAAMVAAAVRDLGGLDVLYANAGVSGGDVPIHEQTVELWEEVLRVNLIGPFLAVKHAGAHMVAQGRGAIVCTASVAGLRANAGGNPYSASKAGVVSLVQTAANSFWGTGVRINAICPGLIETGMTRPIFDHARAAGHEDKLGQINPLQRYGLPQEIAAAALFLASDEASYVNGQALPVDGGLTSTLPFKRRVR